MTAIVGLFLLILGVFVYIMGRLPAQPGRLLAFATHVFLWRSSGHGLPKLCFCAVALSPGKFVIFLLGVPKIVLQASDAQKIDYHGGNTLSIQTKHYHVRLFVKFPEQWAELIRHQLRVEEA